MTPYVRVLNALDRRDALFYQFNRGTDVAPRPLATLPVLPLIGVEWRLLAVPPDNTIAPVRARF